MKKTETDASIFWLAARAKENLSGPGRWYTHTAQHLKGSKATQHETNNPVPQAGQAKPEREWLPIPGRRALVWHTG